MVFSGIPFLFYYLPLLLLVYYAVPQTARFWRNNVLLVASLIFYAWGEGFQLLLLLLSIVVNHLFSRVLTNKLRQDKAYLLLFLGIAFNLGLLTWYKYSVFFASSLGYSSWQAPALPLGISFFTFQAISYLVDVYRKEASASKSVLETALYISSFPQLIAGPIVRYKYVAEQITRRRETLDKFFLGIQIFILGLAQKVLIANLVGESADTAFNSPVEQLDSLSAWIGVFSYGLQIYFDFAGYSNMAIGLGLMLGFRFPKNFNAPYSALSVTEFWRKWHMTLSEWFRDYLYIPLGGNRRGSMRTIINLWLVFVLCGLWHGAALNFIAWGAWHGFFLSIERLGLQRVLDKLWKPIRHTYLLLSVFLAWVLFRADSLEHATNYYRVLFITPFQATDGTNLINLNQHTVVFMLLCLALSMMRCNVLGYRTTEAPGSLASQKTGAYTGLAALAALGAFVVCVSALVANSFNPFIYFRF